jgi:hypothetical protein
MAVDEAAPPPGLVIQLGRHRPDQAGAARPDTCRPCPKPIEITDNNLWAFRSLSHDRPARPVADRQPKTLTISIKPSGSAGSPYHSVMPTARTFRAVNEKTR